MELALNLATRVGTTLTFRFRHIAPQSFRAARATAKEATTASHRRQAAPLGPAHPHAAVCVRCCEAEWGGARLGVGENPQARGPVARSHWLILHRGGAFARALWAPPAPGGLRWERLRTPLRRAVRSWTCRCSLTFAGCLAHLSAG